MIREVSLEEISDGKLYDLHDMVKAGCGECRDCFACCRGMGTSVVLDPFDIYRMAGGLGKAFEQLLAGALELNIQDGIILPNLNMAGEQERCGFLNGEGRCSIHPFRPGICRLFPLGRYYEDRGFRYFLQVHECRKTNRTKVKISQWMDTPNPRQYETFISRWHYFLADLSLELRKRSEDPCVREINLFLLNLFFVKPYEKEEEFYPQFEARLQQAESFLAGTLK